MDEEKAKVARPDGQLFYEAFKVSAVGIALENLEGQPLFANRALCSMLGFTEEELRNKHCVEFSPPEDAERDWALFEELRAGSIDHYSLEKRFFRRDGSLIWGRLTISLLNSSGPPLVVAIVEDITEKRRTQEELTRSEEKFSKAFRESPLVLTLTRASDHRFLDVNETFTNITGWSREEVIGRTPFDIGSWVNPSRRVDFIAKLLSGGSVRNVESSFRLKNADVRTGFLSMELIEVNGEPCVLSVVVDATDLKRAEEAKQVAEHHFSQFFATVPEYCYMISPDGTILDVNPAACEALGYSKEDLVGKPVSIIYAPESLSKMLHLREKWNRTGRLRNEEMVILTKFGERRVVLVNAGAVVGKDGKPLHCTSVHVDITERKQAAEALRKSEEKFSKAFLRSPTTISITSARDHRYVEVNETFERLTGYTREEAIGRTPFDLGTWVHNSQRVELIKRLLAEGGTHNVETGFRRKDGRIWIGSSSLELIEIDREPCVLISTVDITEQQRAERALRESEERFRLVANTAPVMIWMSGVDKLCTYFNQPWLEFTGRSIEAERGDGWAQGVHSEDLGRCWDAYAKAFDRREPFQIEYRLRRHDGEYRWILDSAVPRFNPDGSFAGYIGSAIDVSDRKLAEAALSTVSRKLIEAHEEERTRIARELHDDINQRLALLVVSLEGLQRNPASSAAIMREIAETIKQVEDLASDVQALSHRLHSSKLEYLGLTGAAAGFCREFSERQGVQIDFGSENVPGDLPKEISICLFRVLQEVLRNAAKHSGSRHFQVSMTGGANEIELTVRDSGIGFDPDEAMKGRGLGLTSIRERLKLVSGSLSIDSQLQRGTTVHAHVPLTSRMKSTGAAG